MDFVFGIQGSTAVAILGIFVTILTGLIRFRRPEERWKHYRRLTEDYQRELWSFLSLNATYKGSDHKTAFDAFNDKMTILRQNDVRVFLGEVATSTTTQGEMQQFMDQNYDITRRGATTADAAPAPIGPVLAPDTNP